MTAVTRYGRRSHLASGLSTLSRSAGPVVIAKMQAAEFPFAEARLIDFTSSAGLGLVIGVIKNRILIG